MWPLVLHDIHWATSTMVRVVIQLWLLLRFPLFSQFSGMIQPEGYLQELALVHHQSDKPTLEHFVTDILLKNVPATQWYSVFVRKSILEGGAKA